MSEKQPERFRVLVADPGWSFKDRLPGGGRGAAKHYNCQTLEEIQAQRLPPMFDDAVLLLWRVAACELSEAAHWIERAWGFEHKTEIVWRKRGRCGRCKGAGRINARQYVEQSVVPASGARAKIFNGTAEVACPNCGGEGATRHFGMGRITRNEHEVCYVATRGRASKLVLAHNVRSTFTTDADIDPERDAAILRHLCEGSFDGLTREHSEKPEEFYRLVEDLFPGPYVELNARRRRPGWTQYGHQLDEDDGTFATPEEAARLGEKLAEAARDPETLRQFNDNAKRNR